MRLMLPAHRVIGHREYGNTPPGGWPGRKQDPTYSMDWRRNRVATFRPRTVTPQPQEDDMPLTATDEAYIKQYGSLTDAIAQRTRVITRDVGGDTSTTGLRAALDRIIAMVEQADSNDAPEVLAAAIVAELPQGGSGAGGSLSVADVEGAVKRVLGSVDNS